MLEEALLAEINSLSEFEASSCLMITMILQVSNTFKIDQ